MLINWISVKDAMPAPFTHVLVAGGMAYWDDYNWYTLMESKHLKLEWEVTHWAPFPKKPVADCSSCVALQQEIDELKEKIATVCGAVSYKGH